MPGLGAGLIEISNQSGFLNQVTGTFYRFK